MASRVGEDNEALKMTGEMAVVTEADGGGDLHVDLKVRLFHDIPKSFYNLRWQNMYLCTYPFGNTLEWTDV